MERRTRPADGTQIPSRAAPSRPVRWREDRPEACAPTTGIYPERDGGPLWPGPRDTEARTQDVPPSDPETSRWAAQVADALDLLAALVALSLIELVDIGWSGPLRVLLALGFAFFVPGRAVISHWPFLARWSEIGMPVVFSLAVLTPLAMIALWAHVWHPLGLFQIEAWISLAGLIAGIARRHLRIPGFGRSSDSHV